MTIFLSMITNLDIFTFQKNKFEMKNNNNPYSRPTAEERFNKLTEEQQNHWLCQDCKKNCFLSDYDYYMVQDILWIIYGVGDEMLCLECLQKRMCRKLTYKDFTDCILNEKNSFVEKLK